MTNEPPRIKTYRASGQWAAPLTMNTTTGGYDDVMLDLPPTVGGTATAPAPLDYVLSSFIGCAGLTLGLLARPMGLEYAGFEGEVDAELDLRGYMGAPDVCRHFCSVRATFILDTHESDERMQAVVALVEDRCPVLNLFVDAGVPTEIVWRRKGAETEPTAAR